MNVSLAVLADYASVSREGKLNIMGIFDSIMSAKVPAAHSQMQLVIAVEGATEDSGTEPPIEIEMTDPGGDSVLKVEGKIIFGKAPTGSQVRANSNIQLNNLVFKDFGRYCFKISINGKVYREIPFTVVQISRQ